MSILARGIHRLKRGDWYTMAALAVFTISYSFGMAAIVRPLSPSRFFAIALLSLLVGSILARLPAPAFVSTSIAVLCGALLIFLQSGSLIADLTLIVDSLVEWTLNSLEQNLLLSFEPIHAQLQLWFAENAILANRLGQWLVFSLRGNTLVDPVASLFFWNVSVWGSMAWFGLCIQRSWNPLLGAIPALGILSVSLSYTRGSNSYLLIMIGSLLAALILWRFARMEERSDGQLEASQTTRRTVLGTAIVIPFVLVLLAVVVPSLSLSDIARWVQDLRGDPPRRGVILENLGLERAPSAPAEDQFASYRSAGLPTRHLIGNPPELSDELVMVIRIESTSRELRPGSYAQWRGLTYDYYSGRGWSTQATRTVSHSRGEDVVENPDGPYIRLVQEVSRYKAPTEIVYTWGNLIRVDREYKTAWRKLPQELEEADLFAATAYGDRYIAASNVPVIGEKDLRRFAGPYPEWVDDQYFQLPETISERVVNLALDLTATEPTPYDRAMAIERYLRGFEYTLEIPPPPRGVELVDHFLFESKKGYCDYFSTSMVILARAAGLPARLAVGYLPNQPIENGDPIIITEDLAHSWPEIYFPEYGWIAFEPTAGMDRIYRERESLELVELPENDPFISRFEALRFEFLRSPWVPVSLLVLLTGFSFLVLVQGIQRHRRSASELIQAEYRSLLHHAARLGIPVDQSTTPNELSKLLLNRLGSSEEHGPGSALLRRLERSLLGFTETFTHSRYGAGGDQVLNKKELHRHWRSLNCHLWRAILHTRINARLAKQDDLSAGPDKAP